MGYCSHIVSAGSYDRQACTTEGILLDSKIAKGLQIGAKTVVVMD